MKRASHDLGRDSIDEAKDYLRREPPRDPAVIGTPMLKMVTVYWNPKDYPNRYVARQMWVGGMTESGRPNIARYAFPMVIGDDLMRVRAVINEKEWRLVCTARHPNDDPCIVETWL